VSSLHDDDISVGGTGPYILTIPLHILGAGHIPWTGTGAHNVYVGLLGGGGHYYKARNKLRGMDLTFQPSSWKPHKNKSGFCGI
jgi:hypothetical protein